MSYTSMKREFEREIVSIKTIENKVFPGGSLLYKNCPKYTIKIKINK